MFVPNRSGDDSQNQQPQNRSQKVRLRLLVIGTAIQVAKYEAGLLLAECKENGYWAENYSSFREYVEDETGLRFRTAQELIRVTRACEKANVSAEEVLSLGWSKVALVAGELTAANAKELLQEVKQKTYGQLQEAVRQRRQMTPMSTKKVHAKRTQKTKPRSIVLSEKVQEALRLACLHTHDQATEANLDFVATKFIELCQPPSRLPPRASLN